MAEKPKPVDHGNKHLKLFLRKAMLSLIEPHKALDLFAGRGEISGYLYQGFRELHCVEKDARKFSVLEKNMSVVSGPRVYLYPMENLVFLETRLRGIPGINLIDFDAYGFPNLQIKSFFRNYRIEQPMLIFATDGGKLSCLQGRCFPLGLYSSHEDSKKNKCGFNRGISRAYENLIRKFWHEMAETHGFSINVFRIFWKKKKQVAYYGLLIYPKQ